MTSEIKKESKTRTVGSAKVGQEYVEPEAQDAEGTTEAPKSEAKAAKADALEGWEVGKPAPSDVFWDHESGKFVTEQPVRARGIIGKGELVSDWVLDQLKGGEFA